MHIRIIIADDHKVLTDSMKTMLSAVEGFEIIGEANNGEQLVKLALALKPDIVLTDIQMPEKSGIQATQEIMKQLPATKIMALTMLNESLYIKKMLEAGASGYVIKTIDKDELISAIKSLSYGEKYFSKEVTGQLMNNFQAGKSPADSLTKREKEILSLIAKGFTDKEIAEKIFLSPLTVITHRKNILSKLGLKNKVEIARFAMENGLE